MTDTENSEPIRQVNTSGSILHVPALGVDVFPGEEITRDELLPGFTAVEADAAEAKPADAGPADRPTPPAPAPAAPAPPVPPASPVTAKPADASPADATVKE